MLINLEALDAILVDLDGVITETAKTHAQAWKRMFDEYLKGRAERLSGSHEPFNLKRDYKRYVDGKPRMEGVACFLQSRNIYLPRGEESDLPGKETICGLGNRKNQIYLNTIRQQGVEVYQSSLDFIRRIRRRGLRVAVVTSSRNCGEVLRDADISDVFDAQVDGIVAREWMLEGKPAPDTYLEAARRLGVKPGRAAVIEDSISGVQAGKAGNFGLVIGVNRAGDAELLQQSGADVVVSDLGELELENADSEARPIPQSALEKRAEIGVRIRNRRLAVFLDYDGTLTPIVERPELAVLSDEMRATLKVLAAQCPVFVISGRGRKDVERLVGLTEILYAGCHGFDIAGPAGMEIRHEEGAGYLPVVAQAARDLQRRLGSIEGVIVEDKTYAIAVHYRLVKAADMHRVTHIVDDVLAEHPVLRKTGGKKVFEFRPNINWDKGKAVLWLLDALELNRSDVVPFYVGDDVTDQDAFRALEGRGISILVTEEPKPTCADYLLRDTNEVRMFLWALADMASWGDP